MFENGGKLELDLDLKLDDIKETLGLLKIISYLSLENLDGTDSQILRLDYVAGLFGKSVRSLSLTFDGQTSYTTAFTGLKDTYKKFTQIECLSLKIVSGGNCKLFIDYLDQYPQNFPWWT